MGKRAVVVAIIAAVVGVAVAVGYPAWLVIGLGGFLAVMYLAQTASPETQSPRRSWAARTRQGYQSLPSRQRFVVLNIAVGAGAIAGVIIDGNWNGGWSTVAAFAVALGVTDVVFSFCVRAAVRRRERSPEAPTSN